MVLGPDLMLRSNLLLYADTYNTYPLKILNKIRLHPSDLVLGSYWAALHLILSFPTWVDTGVVKLLDRTRGSGYIVPLPPVAGRTARRLKR